MALFRRNGNWYIYYYAHGQRVREKVGKRKGDAKQALETRRQEILQGRFHFTPRSAVPTFEKFAKRYEEYARANKRGFYNERYRIGMLAEFFGPRKLTDLTSWDAERFKLQRAKKKQPGTVNRDLGNLKNMMTMAVKWGYLSRSPFAGVRPLPVLKKPERILAAKEEAKLLDACKKVRGWYLEATVLLAIHTGMRKGELLSLTWSQVDFAARTIRILNGKSRNAERRIPMNDTVFQVLSDLYASRSDELIFPSSRNPGHRVRDHKKGFAKALKEAGIQHLRFHDLRHTFATRLVRAGVDLITLQHLLGHSNIGMTARYAHCLEDDKIAAVRRLDGLNGVVPAPIQPPDAAQLGSNEEGRLAESTRWAYSSARLERTPDKGEVGGSNPPTPTMLEAGS